MMTVVIRILLGLALFLAAGAAAAQDDPYGEEEAPPGTDEAVDETPDEAPDGETATDETEPGETDETEADEAPTDEAATDEVEPELEGPEEREEPELEEPYIPPVEDDRVEYDDPALEEALESIPDGKPFGKGEMELGFSLAMAGIEDKYYVGLGAAYDYYVVNGLAPGLSISYTTDFGTTDFADSFTALPFLKWVFYRSAKFSPYVMIDAGKEWQWAGAYPVHSWIAGAGFGAHIGIGSHVMINLSILFQHHWYDDPFVQDYQDKDIYKDGDGYEYLCSDTSTCDLDGWEFVDADNDGYIDGMCDPDDPSANCAPIVDDRKDLDRAWVYPIINLGVSIMF